MPKEKQVLYLEKLGKSWMLELLGEPQCLNMCVILQNPEKSMFCLTHISQMYLYILASRIFYRRLLFADTNLGTTTLCAWVKQEPVKCLAEI